MIRVFLCDDARELRELVREALTDEADIEVVGEASEGASCLGLVERTRSDVVLLDLAMPDRDGLEVLDDLRVRTPSTRVVMLSGFSAARIGAAALARGATHYIEKGAALNEITRAIREAAVT